MLFVKGEISMICKTQVMIALAATALAGTLCAEPSSEKYSRAELQQMIREAHSAQQYQALASYYRSRQRDFEEQAKSEKQEWDRRSQNVSGPAAKYPRPVDSSRNRYEYFTYEAQQMSQQAARYEGLSASAK